jgi:uncharacterized cupin superfamily protein
MYLFTYKVGHKSENKNSEFRLHLKIEKRQPDQLIKFPDIYKYCK